MDCLSTIKSRGKERERERVVAGFISVVHAVVLFCIDCVWSLFEGKMMAKWKRKLVLVLVSGIGENLTITWAPSEQSLVQCVSSSCSCVADVAIQTNGRFVHLHRLFVLAELGLVSTIQIFVAFHRLFAR